MESGFNSAVTFLFAIDRLHAFCLCFGKICYLAD